jgi:hypothetical protein
MNRVHLAAVSILVGLGLLLLTGFGNEGAFWSQWGRNPQHTSMVDVPGQPLDRKLADIVYDTFVEQEKAENTPVYGAPILTAHYQSTLIDGDSFYMVKKSGVYPSCDPPLSISPCPTSAQYRMRRIRAGSVPRFWAPIRQATRPKRSTKPAGAVVTTSVDTVSVLFVPPNYGLNLTFSLPPPPFGKPP